MLLITRSSFLCTSIKLPYKICEETKVPRPINFSNKRCSKTKFSLCLNNESNCSRRSSKRIAAVDNGDPYFTALQQPMERDHVHGVNDNAGIGIVEFFEGKNIFITGATGFLGKALVEKILSSTRVGKIYILIKAKDKEAAFERLTKEIVNSELFKCLKEKHGKSYETFVRKKLIPTFGNICEPNLGMDSGDVDAIKRDVNVIIESAAITTINGRYDLLLDANVNAPMRLMRFAKTCKNLELFAHISTAYVSGNREGVIFEEPLTIGQNEISCTFHPLDAAHEMKLAFNSCSGASTDYDMTKEMRRLGQERADLYGWQNVYQMTKAMGEMALNEIRGDVPLLIIRPSVIESSYRDPFPGWIQGNRMSDPVLIAFGKGQLPALLADPETHVDMVPVDIVANTTMAAIAKHGFTQKSEVSVYHVASSIVNPLTASYWFGLMYEYFNSTTLLGQQTIEKIKLFDNFNDLSLYTREKLSRRHGHTVGTDQYRAKVAYAEQLAKLYEFMGFFNARFHTGNTQKLLGEMSQEEKLGFDVDATNIDWRNYIQEIHIPGVMKHVIKARE